MLNKIQRGFSKSAGVYDRYSALHREIADGIWARVTRDVCPSAVLDVGCGTGYLTYRLKAHWPQSRIVGLDFAEGMIEAARARHEGINWVLGDMNELPFAEESFNLVVSNLAYQWAEDLKHAFKEVRRVLAADGHVVLTLFGYRTCQELFQSLQEANNKAMHFNRLADESLIRDALASVGFKNFTIDSELMKVEFASMHELMMWLKSIGANHLSHEGYLGREVLNKASGIYQNKFSYLQGVTATFEVIRIYGQK